MDNKAGATTKPRRSARTTRQTRKNEDTQVDETDSGTKAANPPRKRRKVAKADIATAGGEQAIAPKPRRKTGKLSNLLDMPIDILYEVFSQLDPFDILKLTRTSKDLRNLLLNKTAVSVWKESLHNVPGLPDCPSDMSIPAYVNLLFSAHCHICSACTRTVEWRFRMRICKKCVKDEVTSLYNLFYDDKEGAPALGGLDFHQLCAIIPNRTDKRGHYLYAKSMFQTISDEYDLLDGEDAKRQFIKDRMALVKMIYQHAAACEIWEKNRTDSRHQDLSALKEERFAAIVQRLEALGWGDEVMGIRRPDSLADHKLVNRPQRLTDKIWSNIKDPILQYMEQMRVKRLGREFQTLITRRKGPAIEAIREYKKLKLADGQVLPGPPDYCAFEPIQEILKKPVDVEITPSSFDPVIPLLPGLISQWRDKLDLAMAKQTGVKYWNAATAPSTRMFNGFFSFDQDSDDDDYPFYTTREPQLSDAEAIQKMKLASAVFTCKASRCSTRYDNSFGFFVPPIPYAKKIMFYPQVLAHRCNYIGTDGWSPYDIEFIMGYRTSNEPDPSTLLGVKGSMRRKQWDCRSIAFHHEGKKVAEAVIKIAGLDPGKATSQEMDDLNLRFICNTCFDIQEQKLPDPTLVEDPEPEDYEDLHIDVGLFDWRAAVRHSLDRHSANEVKFSAMKPDEFSDEIKIAEQKLRERTTEEWQCVHCMDTRDEKQPNNLQAIKEHLLTEHKIDTPIQDEDYFRHPGAPDLHLFQRPLWVSRQAFDPCGELNLIPPYTKHIKNDDGSLVRNEDGTLKEEIVDHDDYEYSRSRVADVDQYDTLHHIDNAYYSEPDSDMDDEW